jgi:hypothetical protein
LRLNAGTAVAMFGAVAPGPLGGVDVYGELESGAPSWLSPSLRIAVLAAKSHIVDSFAQADFALGVVQAEGCPLRFPSHGDLSLRPCASVDVGWVHAQGVEVTRPYPADRPWFDVRAMLRGRWSPRQSALFAEASGGFLIPVTQPVFVFHTPTVEVHRVPMVGGVASAGVGIHFR